MPDRAARGGVPNEVWAEVYDRHRRADPRAPHDARVREHAPARRARRAPARRAARRRTRSPRTTAASRRSCASTPSSGSRRGELKALVATASLELGIDIGDVDLVCQLGSPRAIATFLQRVGRSGHALGGMPKGRLFPLTRDELVECAALLDGVRRGELDAIEPAQSAARHPRAADRRRGRRRASGDRGSCYAALHARGAAIASSTQRATSTQVLAMLVGRLHDAARPRGRARALAIASTACCAAGAARGSPRSRPAARSRTARLRRRAAGPNEHRSARSNEDFAIESMAGDIFQLGNTRRSGSAGSSRARCASTDAHGAPPTIPFWLGEAPGAHATSCRTRSARLRADARAELARGDGRGRRSRWLGRHARRSARPRPRSSSTISRPARAALGALPTQDR